MLRFRPKLGSERNSEWRCFFCLHIRTGTILLGSWHLLLHLIALGFLVAIVRDPNALEELQKETVSAPNWNVDNTAVSTSFSKIDAAPTPPREDGDVPINHTTVYHDVDVGALVTVCTFAITLMLIYGAARGRPSHLLPFFCLQMFDFSITLLTAIGYLCYLRSVHRLVAETRGLPFRAQLLQLPAPALAFVVLSAFILAVLVKAYNISVVWRCYKYLSMRVNAMRNLTPFVISSDSSITPAYISPPTQPPPDFSSLLPDYEEAVKQTPPPSYRDATMMAHAVPNNVTPPQTTPEAASQAPVPTTASNTIVMLTQGSQARV